MRAGTGSRHWKRRVFHSGLEPSTTQAFGGVCLRRTALIPTTSCWRASRGRDQTFDAGHDHVPDAGAHVPRRRGRRVQVRRTSCCTCVVLHRHIAPVSYCTGMLHLCHIAPAYCTCVILHRHVAPVSYCTCPSTSRTRSRGATRPPSHVAAVSYCAPGAIGINVAQWAPNGATRRERRDMVQQGSIGAVWRDKAH